MLHRYIAVLGMACLSLVLVAASNCGSPSGDAKGLGELHVNDEADFEIRVPEGWQTSPSPQFFGASAIFTAPESDYSGDTPFLTNINVLVQPAGTMTLGQATDSTLRSMERRLAGFELIGQTPGEQGGMKTLTLDFYADHIGDNVLRLRQVQLIAVDDVRVFYVTGTTLADTWNKHAETLTASLQSLRAK